MTDELQPPHAMLHVVTERLRHEHATARYPLHTHIKRHSKFGMIGSKKSLDAQDLRHIEDPKRGIHLMAAVMPKQIVDPRANADAAHSLIAASRNAEETV